MRLSKKAKLLYIHIPRTGGLSVIQLMKSEYRDTRRIAWEHARLKDVKKKVDLRKYWKFSIVRNSYERMVSLFCFLSQRKRYYDTRKGKARHTSELLDLGFTDWLINYGKKSHNIITSNTPQFDWISINGKIAVDHIIRYENLQKEIKKIFGKAYKKLGNYHKSEHKPYQEYYDDESKAYVDRVFARDIKKFKYEF